MTAPLALVRSFYAAVAVGDVAGVLGVLHPDLHWTEAEGFPYYTGTWRHPQDVVEKLLVPLSRDWDDFSAAANDFIVEEDRVVALGTYSGRNRATGKSIRVPFAHLWRVADDKLQRFDMYTDTLLVDRSLRNS